MSKKTCPSCNTSYAVRYLIKSDEYRCTHCGWIGKLPSKELIEDTKQKIHKAIDEQA